MAEILFVLAGFVGHLDCTMGYPDSTASIVLGVSG